MSTRVFTRRDRWATRLSRHVGRFHTALFRRTGGRFGRRFRGGDVVLLTVRGRRSGQLFTTPLLYVRDGDDYIVAASNGGVDHEPQWWLNLKSEPRGQIEAPGVKADVIASEVEGDLRTVLWGRLVATRAGYEAYQARVRRRIAVVRLSPAWSSPGSRRRPSAE